MAAEANHEVQKCSRARIVFEVQEVELDGSIHRGQKVSLAALMVFSYDPVVDNQVLLVEVDDQVVVEFCLELEVELELG